MYVEKEFCLHRCVEIVMCVPLLAYFMRFLYGTWWSACSWNELYVYSPEPSLSLTFPPNHPLTSGSLRMCEQEDQQRTSLCLLHAYLRMHFHQWILKRNHFLDLNFGIDLHQKHNCHSHHYHHHWGVGFQGELCVCNLAMWWQKELVGVVEGWQRLHMICHLALHHEMWSWDVVLAWRRYLQDEIYGQ